jgi:Domain of unknown function (DUF397)
MKQTRTGQQEASAQTDDYFWFKSSRSTSDGSCVEIAFVGRNALVRDSKDAAGPRLYFSKSIWQVFIDDVKGSESDYC